MGKNSVLFLGQAHEPNGKIHEKPKMVRGKILMSALDSLFTMSHTVEIFVPSTVQIESIADSSLIASVVNKVSTVLAKTFGGTTSTNGIGQWYSDTLAKLISEPVIIVKSFASQIDEESILILVNLAHEIKEELSQENVLISVDNKGYLV